MDPADLTCEVCSKVFANGESLLRHLKKQERFTHDYLKGSPAHEMAKGEMRVRIFEYRLAQKRKSRSVHALATEQKNTRTKPRLQSSTEQMQRLQQEQQSEQQLQQQATPRCADFTCNIVRQRVAQRVAMHLKVCLYDLIIPVPPDGLCLSYCFTASKNRNSFTSGRQLNGFRTTHQAMEAELEKKHASAFFKRVLVLMRADGKHLMATRLELNGSEGYPGLDELQWFANAGKCIAHLYSLESEFADMPMAICGNSGPVISIGHTSTLDGGGHESSHFVLLNSAVDLSLLNHPGPPSTLPKV